MKDLTPSCCAYDDNGNLISGAGRHLTWTSFDMPATIAKAATATTPAASASFVYGPEHQRSRQTRSDGSVVIYAGAQEVETKAAGGTTSTTIKTYWPYGVGVEIDRANSTNNAASELNWTHIDRLGSPVALSTTTGTLREKLAYDAWGKRRTLDGAPLNGTPTPDTLDGVTDNRGFTGHEMLDQLDLVHMNGRIYDPLTARFMSADPILQDPMNGQSYNRYSYVMNNPTNLTDPTGFASEKKEACTGSNIPGGSCGGGSVSYGEGGGGEPDYRKNKPSSASPVVVNGKGPVSSAAVTNGSEKANAKQPMSNSNGSNFGQFLGDLDIGGIFKQVGRKLIDDFVNNNQAESKGSNSVFGWLAKKLEGTYEKPDGASADGVVAIVAVTAISLRTPGGQKNTTAVLSKEVSHLHHAWPKYLGGPLKQDLVKLDKPIHDAYHSGLDKILPRQWGKVHYENLPNAARLEMHRDLANYTRKFDSIHGTSLFESMIKNGFPPR